MPYFNSHAGKVFYEDIGQGDVLVFIHGRTLDSRMWKPQINFLKSKFRCIAYDLNGFGKSDLPINGYNRVKTLEELFVHLKVNKATLIGLSLGTHVAINFALKHLSWLKSLVLMSPAVPDVEFHKEFLDDWNAIESAGKAQNFVLAKHLWINCKAFKPLEINTPTNYQLFKNMIEDYTCWDINNPPEHDSPDLNVLKKLHKINLPTLVLYGDQDYLDFQNNAKLLMAKLPKSLGQVIEKSGHMVNLEFPGKVNNLILNFLNQN